MGAPHGNRNAAGPHGARKNFKKVPKAYSARKLRMKIAESRQIKTVNWKSLARKYMPQ